MRSGGVALLLATLGAAAASAHVLAACDGEIRFDDHSIPVDGGGSASADGAASPDASASADGAPPPRPPCTDDATCGGFRCDVLGGVCVACLADEDCKGSSRPRCDTKLHVCVACRELFDCGLKGRCDLPTRRCIDNCFDEDDACPSPGFVCSEARRACIECTSSANCAASPNGPSCDPDVGRCVECTSSAQCPADRPVCDRRTGRCAACVSSISCGPGYLCDPTTLVCRAP